MSDLSKKILLKCIKDDERNIRRIKRYMLKKMENNIMEINLSNQDVLRYALSETVKRIN